MPAGIDPARLRRCGAILILAAPLLAAQGQLEGVLLNSVTGAPVPNASVDLRAAGAKDPISHTVTGAAGTFRFSDLSPGEYTASFKAERFYSGQSESVRIATAGDAPRMEGELTPITSIDGRVLDPDGKPLPGFRVEVHGWRMSQSLVTDPHGRFHIFELEPGIYRLLARPNRGMKLPANISQPKTGDQTVWAPTFYPSVTDPAQAIAIHATGGELTGYDIRLRSVPLYRIRGKAFDERGAPAARVPLNLRTVVDRTEFSNPEAETVSAADGSFEFTGVAPGNWRIFAESKRDTLTLSGFVNVMVSRHDEEDLRVRLAAPFAVQGTIDPAGSTEGFYLKPVDAPSSRERYSKMDAEGRFQIPQAYPGRYRISPSRSPGAYLAEARLGDQDVTAQAFDLVPGVPLRLIFRQDVGKVQGRVKDAGKAIVVLFPEGAEDSPLRARCSPDGAFTLDGVRPGRYSAMAFPRIEEDMLFDASFVETLLRHAVSVRVEPSQSVSADLPLTPWPQ